MLIGQRRRLWRRFLPGDVVLEALLVAVFALLGELLLLHLPSFHFICIVQVALGRRILFAGGCFAAVPVWWMLCRCRRVGSSWADALPPWLVVQVDALPPLLGCRPLHPGRCRFC